jgi:crotonobetainyl-CoA:carnitine CoA-transferase CaiB-like acyl-CoA transferase
MVVEIEDPSLGKMRCVNSPMRMSKTPVRTTEPAPSLGQHNDEVLAQYLGLTGKDLEGLRAKEVIK